MFRVHALPEMEELPGSPVEAVFPAEAQQERIARLIERTEALFSLAWHLRQELQAVQAAPPPIC